MHIGAISMIDRKTRTRRTLTLVAETSGKCVLSKQKDSCC